MAVYDLQRRFIEIVQIVKSTILLPGRTALLLKTKFQNQMTWEISKF